MTVSTEQIANSLRLDNISAADTDMIQNYITAAGEYVRNAVDHTAPESDFEQFSQYDIAVAMLTEFWFENRGEISTASQELPYTVTSMIQQLRGRVTSAN